jgi:hypothetical protein
MGKVISLAQTVSPRLTDKYMERSTTASQLTGIPVSIDRRDNLYDAVPYDGGERGRTWTGRTRSTSLYTHTALHPRQAAIVVAAVALTLAAGWRTLRRRNGVVGGDGRQAGQPERLPEVSSAENRHDPVDGEALRR